MPSTKSKKYLPGETKEQRKARKAKEKMEKSSPKPILSKVEQKINLDTKKKNYVCCLKYGDKYSAEYVNKLYRMVKKNLTIEHEFVCFTENSEGIDEDINVMPLPNLPIDGWWYKPLFFNPKLGLNGTLLFLDLDLIIFRNIDYLFTFKPGRFVILQDFNRYIIKNYQKFNSSVFRLDTGQHHYVYADFIKDCKTISKRYPGDQDWIRHCIKKDFEYWPTEWIQSYKWEMRGKPRFDHKPRGHRDFITPGSPKILEETSIAVFHGDPNPHICKDPWVKENWK